MTLIKNGFLDHPTATTNPFSLKLVRLSYNICFEEREPNSVCYLYMCFIALPSEGLKLEICSMLKALNEHLRILQLGYLYLRILQLGYLSRLIFVSSFS